MSYMLGALDRLVLFCVVCYMIVYFAVHPVDKNYKPVSPAEDRHATTGCERVWIPNKGFVNVGNCK